MLTETEKLELTLQSVIQRKKVELFRAKNAFKLQMHFLDNEKLTQAFKEKIFNNALHWEAETERLETEIDILENHDTFFNFVSESQREHRNVLYQCTQGYHCGFPHLYSEPSNCPQCGQEGACVRYE